MENNFSYSQYTNDMIRDEINSMSDTTLNREKFEYYWENLNLSDIKYAIEMASKNNDTERKELLEELYEKAATMRESVATYSKRYSGTGNDAKRTPDEDLLSDLEQAISDLGQESYAGFSTVQNIYVYLTNAQDNTDLLKRLEVVSERIEKYKEILKNDYNIEITGVIEKATNDFESGEILGLHEKDAKEEGRD